MQSGGKPLNSSNKPCAYLHPGLKCWSKNLIFIDLWPCESCFFFLLWRCEDYSCSYLARWRRSRYQVDSSPPGSKHFPTTPALTTRETFYRSPASNSMEGNAKSTKGSNFSHCLFYGGVNLVHVYKTSAGICHQSQCDCRNISMCGVPFPSTWLPRSKPSFCP